MLANTCIPSHYEKSNCYLPLTALSSAEAACITLVVYVFSFSPTDRPMESLCNRLTLDPIVQSDRITLPIAGVFPSTLKAYLVKLGGKIKDRQTLLGREPAWLWSLGKIMWLELTFLACAWESITRVGQSYFLYVCVDVQPLIRIDILKTMKESH